VTTRSTGRVLGTGCWALGAAIVITLYFDARAYADVEPLQGKAAFTSVSSAESAALQSGSHSVDGQSSSDDTGPDQSQWSRSRIGAFVKGFTSGPQVVPEALLRIPGVRLMVPVYANDSKRNLNRGAGFIQRAAQPDGTGNLTITAHRDGFFRALKDVIVGDVIEIEKLSGTRRYQVTELSIVNPTDTKPLRNPEQAAVRLVTGYPFYCVGSAPRLYVVRAVAVAVD
jgi:sortase A